MAEAADLGEGNDGGHQTGDEQPGIALGHHHHTHTRHRSHRSRHKHCFVKSHAQIFAGAPPIVNPLKLSCSPLLGKMLQDEAVNEIKFVTTDEDTGLIMLREFGLA